MAEACSYSYHQCH